MLKGKYVISVYLRCMKGKSPSGKFPACKQITRPEFLLVYIFRFLCLPVGVRERLRDESRGRQVIFMRFATLIGQQFFSISNWKSCRCTGFSDLPRTFPLFSPESKSQSKPESQQLIPNGRMFAWHINSAECTEKILSPPSNTFSMKKDLIDIFAPPAFIRESANRAAKPI